MPVPVDLLHLLRSLRRTPVSAAAAVLTIALTIGAGASIFSVVDVVLLTPPPFANPRALVTLGEVPIDEPAAVPRAVRYATLEAWRGRAAAVAALEAFDATNVTLTELGAAERVSASDVTPGFLRLLGIEPALGRTFEPEDAGEPVAIVSHAFWRARLAADPAAVRRQIVLGGQAHTVVGVLPARFVFGLNACDVWRPIALPRDPIARANYPVRVIARLRPTASAALLQDTLEDAGLGSAATRVVATDVAAAIAGDRTTTLRLLAAAAAVAILIAFTNLAGLLLVRSIDRRRELAVRTALGARRVDAAKQWLLEALVLVALGTGAGVLVAFWMTPVVAALGLARFGPQSTEGVAVSWRVIGGVSLAAFICACVCAALPLIATARRGAADLLRRGMTPSTQELTLRRIFVAGEVALAFVLLVSMTLLGRTLLAVLAVNPGFDAGNVMTLQVSLPRSAYPTGDSAIGFYSSLQGALEARLGQRTVAIVDELPLTGDGGRTRVDVRHTDEGHDAVVRTASPGYFAVMRIPVVAGRGFQAEDDSTAPLRAVISRQLAERLFSNASAIGRRVWIAAGAQMAEVVGVVGEVTHRALDEANLPTVYLSAMQAPSLSSIIVVRSGRSEADVIAAVRQEVGGLDARLPVYRARTMAAVVAASPPMPARRLLTAAFTGFAALAVVLTAIGLFGVVAHDVARRRGELALRIALGAAPMRLLRATLGQGALMVGSGLAAGALLSLWTVRGLGGAIAIAGRPDAVSVGVAIAILMVTAACAVLPAAVRAARTDPLTALRGE